MPDDAAAEKAATCAALGAEVARVRPVGIAHPHHFVNVARRAAEARMHDAAQLALYALCSHPSSMCAGGDGDGRARRGLFCGSV
jgi:cysteine synthase